MPSPAANPYMMSTFENVQAGLRTDYLFRLAGQHGGFVLGTGDLSRNWRWAGAPTAWATR